MGATRRKTAGRRREPEPSSPSKAARPTTARRVPQHDFTHPGRAEGPWLVQSKIAALVSGERDVGATRVPQSHVRRAGTGCWDGIGGTYVGNPTDTPAGRSGFPRKLHELGRCGW